MNLRRQTFTFFCLVSLLLSGCTNPFAEDTVSTEGMCTGDDDSQSGLDESCTIDDIEDEFGQESDDASSEGDQTADLPRRMINHPQTKLCYNKMKRNGSIFQRILANGIV